MKAFTLLVFSICLFFISCGYGLEKAVSPLPSNIKTVAIDRVRNPSVKKGLSSLFLDELSRQFTTSKFLTIANLDQAHSILRVNIVSVRVEGATLTNITKTSSRLVIITVNGNLKENRTGKTLWKSGELTARRTYVVDADPIITEMNEELALKSVARDLAEKIHNNIFVEF